MSARFGWRWGLALVGLAIGLELGACQLTQCVRHSDCGSAEVCNSGLCGEPIPEAEEETEGAGSDGADPGMAAETGGGTPATPPNAGEAGDGGSEDDGGAGTPDADDDEAGSSDGGDGPQRDPSGGPMPPPPPRRDTGGTGA